MEKNITKSPEMLAKEAKIKGLQKTLKKRKSVLKSLKTRLKNTKNEVEEVQRNIQNIMFSKTSKLDSLRIEIGELALEMKKNKHFSKADKKALNEMSEEFLDGSIFGDQFDEIREAKRKAEEGDFDFDENFRAKMNDAFQQFRVEPEEKEQKDIRKVFIKLSRKFHPDLAENDKQAKEYHGMMQQINEAYKTNDIHALLEMEQLYLMEELNLSTASITIDVLQNEIDRLERDVDFINGQVGRTSLEIKQLRKSEMGSMLTGIKRADKEGEGIEAMEAQFDQMIAQLEQIKAGFQDSIERGSISPILIQMMNPFAGLFGGDMSMPDRMPKNPEELEDMLGDLFGMMMEEENDYQENENPKFPLDSTVKVKKVVKHPFNGKLSMKGWQGWIDEAYFDEAGKPVYTVLFDTKTMELMPKKLLEEAAEIGADFQEYDFKESELQATTERESQDAAMITYRKLKTKTEWSMLVHDEYLEMITTILLTNPEESEEINWENYLKSCTPFEAKGKGKFDLKRNKKVTVKSILGLNEEVGFLALIHESGKKKKRPYPYPLQDLFPTDNKMKIITELHNIWFNEIYLQEEEEDDFFSIF